jgi:cytochrome c peroxidase
LRLFIDSSRTQCMQCHNGPQLTNGGFHNIGTGTFAGEVLDFGRALGIRAVLLDEFNCLGPYSDARPEDCQELRFLNRDAHIPMEGAFKTPSLRDVEKTAPYMHDGRHATLRAVLDYYNAPPQGSEHELRPLGLSDRELEDLEHFLRALSGDAIPPASAWSDSERALLATLRLAALPEPPPDPGNGVGDRPEAAALGLALFFDTGLSANGRVACSTCHQPERAFTDGLRKSLGLGPLRRNAPSLLDIGHERWLYRDGRADSLWSQALVPLEHPDEMGGSRLAIMKRVASDPRLAQLYEAAFGSRPPALDGSPERTAVDRAFTNLGKALAAYERTLRSRPTRFDGYVDALLEGRLEEAERLLDPAEVAGLRVFLSGRSGCLSCHLGPRFTDGRFHNVGTGDLGTPREDLGREQGRQILRSFEFNCLSPYGDSADCRHLERMWATEVQGLLRGAFRTPGLRNLATTAPYMHDGRFQTLEEVLSFYRNPPAKAETPHELPAALDLTDLELRDLAKFLRSLDPATGP